MTPHRAPVSKLQSRGPQADRPAFRFLFEASQETTSCSHPTVGDLSITVALKSLSCRKERAGASVSRSGAGGSSDAVLPNSLYEKNIERLFKRHCKAPPPPPPFRHAHYAARRQDLNRSRACSSRLLICSASGRRDINSSSAMSA